MKILSRIVPTVFMLVIAGVAAVVLWRVAFKDLPGPSPTDKHTIADYNRCVAEATTSDSLNAKVLKQCAEDLAKNTPPDDYGKSRMDEMRWMLTIIGSLAAFFVVAQSASAYFVAQSYSRTADEAITRIKEQEAAVRARYPLFADVERKRDEAYSDLRAALQYVSKIDDPSSDPLEAITSLERFYEQLGVEQRQRILSVESFASIDLDPGRSGEQAHANDLVRLAVFYISKFAFEDRASRGNIADVERAESYLRLAYTKSGSDFTVLNELGHLYLIAHKSLGSTLAVDFLDKAQTEFRRSLNLEPKQQRPYYDMAVIEGKYRKDFSAALKHLDVALLQENWQRVPVRYTRSFIYYNHACYSAQQLAKAAQPWPLAEVQSIVDSLKKAAAFRCVPKDNIIFDFEDISGDFYKLGRSTDPFVVASIQEAEEILLRSHDGPHSPTPNLLESLKEALTIVRKAVFK